MIHPQVVKLEALNALKTIAARIETLSDEDLVRLTELPFAMKCELQFEADNVKFFVGLFPTQWFTQEVAAVKEGSPHFDAERGRMSDTTSKEA